MRNAAQTSAKRKYSKHCHKINTGFIFFSWFCWVGGLQALLGFKSLHYTFLLCTSMFKYSKISKDLQNFQDFTSIDHFVPIQTFIFKQNNRKEYMAGNLISQGSQNSVTVYTTFITHCFHPRKVIASSF